MIARRAAVLRERDFRRFYAGYVTSLLGTAMSTVAVAFAVLDSGGTATDLGLVFAAGIVPQVVLLLSGGVIADRFSRRWVMLTADAVRCAAQAGLAAALFLGRPHIWLFVLAVVVRNAGDAFFNPALSALTVEITPPDQLGDANAMFSLARSAAAVAGPALAGILIAVTSPAVVLAVDAASYGASVLALSLIRPRSWPRAQARSMLRELRDGWAEFRSRTWLVVTAVQFTLFNLFLWGPYLLLGPVLSKQYLGGARAWGTIMAAYGAGSVIGGLAALGRRPRRPIIAGTILTVAYAAPAALLALHAPLTGVAGGALVAGFGSAMAGAFEATALQHQVPPAALGRVTAIQAVTAFAFGPLAFAAAGPAAAAVGARPVLAFGAAVNVLGCAVVLAIPAVRAVTWRLFIPNGSAMAANASAASGPPGGS